MISLLLCLAMQTQPDAQVSQTYEALVKIQAIAEKRKAENLALLEINQKLTKQNEALKTVLQTEKTSIGAWVYVLGSVAVIGAFAAGVAVTNGDDVTIYALKK